MVYDDRSVKPMSASLMRARIATRILAGLYEDVPTMLTSAVRLAVELPGGKADPGPPYPFTIGVSPAWCSGVRGAKLVGTGKLDLVWLNPSVIASMAVRGKGPFRRAYPLRALAVFPSWDRLVVAASPKLGVRTMEELIAMRPKMSVSIAVNDCVDFAIRAMLKAHGISRRDFIDWGGTIDEVVRPSNPRRREGIVSGDVHLVIDEGMDSWGDVAVQHGMVFLSFSEKALRKLERYGFKRARVDGGRVAGIEGPVTAVDFSGWPIVVHEKFPEELAYRIAAVLERIREEIPYDAPAPPPMRSLCTDTDSGPLDIPLHPGAERYYREKGYL
ncbi:MAG TPA: TAXI family TRAP transporter solute-binding subunit [candidate division Zixibacteria bacterium]|nr:TAXI family TRAP transporter solute-binding subunit [candidate division Zixibacteria bacterium]